MAPEVVRGGIAGHDIVSNSGERMPLSTIVACCSCLVVFFRGRKFLSHAASNLTGCRLVERRRANVRATDGFVALHGGRREQLAAGNLEEDIENGAADAGLPEPNGT